MSKKVCFMLFFLMSVTVIQLTGCEKEPIYIGFSGNLSGTSSELPVECMYGAVLAVEEINENGGVRGRELRLIIEDDGNSDETALEADKRLVEQGVVGIIGHILSGTAGKAVPYINEENVVMVSPTITSKEFAGADDYFFMLSPSTNQEGEAIATTLEKQGYSKPGYLYQEENQRYALTLVDSVIEISMKSNIETVFKTSYSEFDEKELEEAVEMIGESETDCLVIVGSAYDVARYAQLLRKRGIDRPIITSSWAMGHEMISLAGQASEGIYAVNTYDITSTEEAFIAFTEAYIEKYQREPTYGSIYTYDAVNILATAIEESKSLSGADIKKALESADSYRSIHGEFQIDEYGDAIRDMYVFQVKDGAYIKVD